MNEDPYAGMDGPGLRDALFAEKNVQPIKSVNDWAYEGIMDNAELQEFREWVTVERKAD